MADNVTADPGAGGATFATDDDGTAHHPYVKLEWGADNTQTKVAAGAGALPIQDGGNSITVDGTVGVSGTVTVDASGATVPVSNAGLTELAAAINASAQMDVNIAASNATVTVTGAGGTFPVTDSAGSLTVDAPVATPVFVRLSDGAAAIATLPVSLATVPSHAVTNAGTFAVQVDGSALTALQKIDDPVLVDDAGFTPATSSVMMAGFQADETATDSVDEGDAGAARMTLDRKVIVTLQPHTAGGCSVFQSLDIDETEEDVKTAAGQVYGWSITNFATSVRHVKFYNATAANVTVGTTAPVFTISVPGNATDDTQSVFNLGGQGIAFDTAICVACTTGLANNDTGAPGASDVSITVFYK